MAAVLQTEDLPQDVSGAEAALLSHLEHRAEIDSREASFTEFAKQGQALIQAGHYASKEVCYTHTNISVHAVCYVCVLSMFLAE